MRGRRPDPEAVKSQKEAVRSTRERPDVAVEQPAQRLSVAAAGDAPTWLQGAALEIWNRLAPTLRKAKLLTAADVEAFGRYCRNFARWLRLHKMLDDEGETYETETYLIGAGDADAPQRERKLKRAHPAFLIADRLERQLLAIEDRFGLNPAERQRIFAARAQTGVSGDLFAAADKAAEKRKGDVAATAAEPAEPIESPIGLLN